MAVFRKQDREKRRAWKAYHASALSAAKAFYAYSDPEDGEARNLRRSWYVYKNKMEDLGVNPLSQDKFLKALAK